MRVIAGRLGGRNFEAPRGHRTHPMAERVRGALFSALGDIEGLSVLDAFSGSGALSFEAISRGASHATAIEIDKNAHQAIKDNIDKLGLDGLMKAVRANSSGWSDNNPDKHFDLVFAAPPYDSLQERTLEKLSRHVRDGGLYVLDWPGKQDPPKLDKLELIKANNYGDAQLLFFKKSIRPV